MIYYQINNKNISTTFKIFYNLQNHPIFHSMETLVNLVRGREYIVGLSISLVYGLSDLTELTRQLTSLAQETLQEKLGGSS